jgi:hypothetical protein
MYAGSTVGRFKEIGKVSFFVKSSKRLSMIECIGKRDIDERTGGRNSLDKRDVGACCLLNFPYMGFRNKKFSKEKSTQPFAGLKE